MRTSGERKAATAQGRPRWSYGAAAMASNLAPLSDFLCLIFSAWLGLFIRADEVEPVALSHKSIDDVTLLVLVAIVLAPFILYDKRFVADAGSGRTAELARAFVLRFAMFIGVVLALGAISHALDSAPRRWLAIWIGASLLSMAVTRVCAARVLRRQQRAGILADVIAVVGAGPAADVLVQALARARPERVDLLGLFDDRTGADSDPFAGAIKPVGTIAQLIELGKTRRIDWIVLTQPFVDDGLLNATVQRLKSLSAPIVLCPQQVDMVMPRNADPGAGMSMRLPADRRVRRRNAMANLGYDCLPRWMLTWVHLALIAGKVLADAFASRIAAIRAGSAAA
jgi:FlaA1/EpsC-like NDP-sugar epimerase